MLVLRNMDELFDDAFLPLDTSSRLFAAGHACVCNPRRLAHYPPSFRPSACAFTAQQHSSNPDAAQSSGGDPLLLSPSHAMLNGGLVVLRPSESLFAQITAFLSSLSSSSSILQEHLPFADQSLLSTLFRGRWVALPYVYNALRTMRWRGVHDALWRDERVKCVHYILTPKPWEEGEGGEAEAKEVVDNNGRDDVTRRWWVEVDRERRRWERSAGVEEDGW
ncbi:hypothetical protein VTK56DRAFT_4454 [Thermocarpiscus australiensis]